MNGNVTEDGVRKDIDWMSRVGLGGLQAFDASLGTPQVVDKRLVFMTSPWIAAFRTAAALADSHGMELGIAASPGWSETGGPWVKPEQAMKKLVWSRTELQGGRRFRGRLPGPPDVAGPIQDLPAAGFLGQARVHPAPAFYRDAMVLAYRIPGPATRPSRAWTRDGEVDAGQLSDGSLRNGPALAVSGGETAWIALRYRQPVTIRGLTVAVDAAAATEPIVHLQTSEDGKLWTEAAQAPATGFAERTIAFAPVTARLFRVTFEPSPPPPPPSFIAQGAPGAAPFSLAGTAPAGPPAYVLHELVLHTAPVVHRFEEKAGFAVAPDYYALAASRSDAGGAVEPAAVIDLTARMRADGTLDWTPPSGRWAVLRLGYSLIGVENHPATDEATGLEVDKLSRTHVRADMEAYLDLYAAAAGPGMLGARGVRALLTDSIETGPQNWTEDLPGEFQRRRGYRLEPWAPALTGVVVQDAQASDRFLWDFRRTLAELIAENHYGQVADSAHARGLVYYGEALEDHRPTLGDDMEMRQRTDIPMAAMWTYPLDKGPNPTFVADIKGAASVAHLYGQNLVAAESLTSARAPWAFAPRDLKPIIDLEFALGVNRPVIHTSVHQPLDRPPGLSLLVFGQSFNRLDTWAEQAGPWVSYIARSAYLLQQGRYVADVAYFYGEEAPLTGLFGDTPNTDVPAGFGYDYVNSDVLLHRLSVDHGRLTTASGMSYRLVYLGGSSRRITLPVLKRLHELVAAGAVLVGERPADSPSQADDPAAVDAAIEALWGGADPTDHPVGQGRVIATRNLGAALATLGVAPDFSYGPSPDGAELMALHRRLDDGDLYFVSNRSNKAASLDASFRLGGREPELWDAATGRVSPAAWRIQDGRTVVGLKLQPYEALFVVFRSPAQATQGAPSPPAETTLKTLAGPWDVAFQPGRGAPPMITLDRLASWSDDARPGVRYFSGSAVYRTTLMLAARPRRGRLLLDLGEVREIAEVSVNGKPVGEAWKPPYRLDITDAAKAGPNRLEIKVTNLWVNRLVGDAQPGAQKIAFTTLPTYRADAPLRPSGLLGPVRVLSAAAGPVMPAGRPRHAAARPAAPAAGLRGPQ